MDLEPWMIEVKEKLEIAHGVRIDKDALLLTCSLLTRYSGAFVSDNEEGGNDTQEVIQRKRAVELLEKACVRLRHDLDTNVEESDLDRDEYFMRRAFVELTEIRKENYRGGEFWIQRVEKEYEGLRSKWVGFLKKWTPILISLQSLERRAEVLQILEQVRQEMLCCFEVPEARGKVDTIAGVIWQLGALVSQLLQTIHDDLKQNLTVSPRMIAEAASPMIGVPPSLILRFLELPLEGLGQRLSESVIGQEHVIYAITNALSKPKSGPHPIGSFLFLGTPGCGRTELSKALAMQLFGQEDMLIEFDMSEYAESNSVSRLIGVLSSDKEYGGVGGQLTEAVKRRPFSVVMFDNIEKAHESVMEVLLEMLRHGKLKDGEGSIVDFTGTLIVMTTNAGNDKFRSRCCKCVRKFPVKNILKVSQSELRHECDYLPFLREVEKHFKPGFLEYPDDVIVLHWLSLKDFMVIARLLLRDIASSMTKKGIILHPSVQALEFILEMSMKGPPELTDRSGHAIRITLQEKLVPVLSDMFTMNEIDDTSIIYIDTPVGVDELSFRVEKSIGLVEDQIYMQIEEFLCKLRTMYRKEKELVNKMYRLRRNYHKLVTLLVDNASANLFHVCEAAQDLVDIVHDLLDLITNQRDANLEFNEFEVAALNSLINGEVELKQGETSVKRAKHGVEGLRSKLCSGLVGQHQAIDVVSNALLKSIDASHDLPYRPAMSFLLLGLTDVGKADLVKGLAELLVADDGTCLLIEVDLSEYTDPDSLFWCTDNGKPGLQLVEAVRTRPHSVIVFYQPEKAHISVFSTLLPILDHGVLNDCHGRAAVDFRNTVVIFVSDLGNKKILTQLVGCNVVLDVKFEQETRGFRSELLNRMDEIVFFDPFVHDQLGKVARLPMRVGPDPVGQQRPRPEEINAFIYGLFRDKFGGVVEKVSRGIYPEVSLMKRYLNNDGNDWMVSQQSCCRGGAIQLI